MKKTDAGAQKKNRRHNSGGTGGQRPHTPVSGGRINTTARLPQGYTHDDTYYYYISQLANTGKHKNDLRVTRIKYKGPGKYSVDYMTLKQFGHGNQSGLRDERRRHLALDRRRYRQRREIPRPSPAFHFRQARCCAATGSTHTASPSPEAAAYATNCYPAISADGTELAVPLYQR